jgi:predicted phage gp36 major capsid-like protein
MDDRLERVIRQQLRKAGRQFEEARRAYAEGREDPDGDAAGAERYDLPTDGDGRARIVCRRHAERRSVTVDAEGRPSCFDPDHPDCEGCAEDVRDGYVETW